MARPKKCDNNFRRSYSSHLLNIDKFVGFNWDADSSDVEMKRRHHDYDHAELSDRFPIEKRVVEV